MVDDVRARSQSARFAKDIPNFLKKDPSDGQETAPTAPQPQRKRQADRPHWALPDVEPDDEMRAPIEWNLLLKPTFTVMSLSNFVGSWISSRSWIRLGVGIPAFALGLAIICFLFFSFSTVGRDENRGRLLEALEDARKAKDTRAQEVLLTSLIEDEPNDKVSRFELARLRQHHPVSKQTMESLVDEDYAPAKLWMAKWHLGHPSPDYSRAEELLQEVISADLHNVEANLELGRLTFQQNQFELARPYLLVAAKSDPKYFLDVARCDAALDEFDRAARSARRGEKPLRRLLEQAPRDVGRRIALADCLSLLGNHGGAESVLRKGLLLDGDNPELIEAQERIFTRLQRITDDRKKTNSD